MSGALAAAIAASFKTAGGGGGSGQTVAQVTAPINWGGTSATVTRTLTGVQAGSRIEIGITSWGGGSQPDCSVTDNLFNTYSVVRAQNSVNGGGKFNAELHYLLNAAAGDYTFTLTHNAASGNRYGWAVVREVRGGLTSAALDTGVTATSTNGGSATSTPSITAAGATAQAKNLIVAVLAVSTNTTDTGIDPATGNSLTWTNSMVKQDPNFEAAGSVDSAPSTSIITPSCAWGTMTGAYNIAALIVAFKDA